MSKTLSEMRLEIENDTESVPCATKIYVKPPNEDGGKNPFYDIPKWVEDCDDLIEYLDLNYAEGCILKSLWSKKGNRHKATYPLREAKKRAHYANRELMKVERENK